jgi:hypothetical protein
MKLVDLDEYDEGGVRGGGSGLQTKAQILAKASLTDFGDVTHWFADDKVVALTSNLTRSYNSSLVQHGDPAYNAPKISAFVREFVVVQRGADGTDHERVFTYDRITLLDTKYRPYYNLCPGPPPVIDGVETPSTWPGTSDPALTANGKYPWEARGPNRWEYAGATCMTVDNVTEPQDAIPGNGKVRVTWLQPSGGRALVHKRGGTSAHSLGDPLAEGAPYYNHYGGWMGLDGEWFKTKALNVRAYAGLYTVAISPNPVTLDTRFLMAADVMDAGDAPDPATNLTCDAQSVAARCGASAVVFSKEAGTHSAGNVTVPNGVKLVVLVNLPAGQTRSLVPGGGLTITASSRTASSTGVLVVAVNGSGVLQFG